ncbi:hypothetical protein BH23ACT10_BH23ACT10_17280 [soil metagenome]
MSVAALDPPRRALLGRAVSLAAAVAPFGALWVEFVTRGV